MIRHGPYRSYPKADALLRTVTSAFCLPKSRRPIAKLGHATAKPRRSDFEHPDQPCENGRSALGSVRIWTAIYIAQRGSKLKSP